MLAYMEGEGFLLLSLAFFFLIQMQQITPTMIPMGRMITRSTPAVTTPTITPTTARRGMNGRVKREGKDLREREGGRRGIKW